MNNIGVICALTTFLNVWLGHVIVRYIEARAVSIKLPATTFLIAGLILVAGALKTPSLPVSAVMGIMGVITIWDAFEFVRQQRRIARGHAPANLKNPRHQRILAQYPSATCIHWLQHEPLGRPISSAEQNAIREASE